MKITIYELLGMIKNGKAPKKIRYDGKFYEFNNKKDNYYENETCSINWDYVSLHCLNEEIEIIEEKKEIPEKINLGNATVNEQQIEFKINEIIDYLKSKGE